LKDGKPFAFAGLWEHWAKGEKPIDSCTILTTDANDLMRPLHDRMPVILDRGDFECWLNPASERAELQTLLRPFAAETLTAYPVGSLVNNTRERSSELREALYRSSLKGRARNCRAKVPRCGPHALPARACGSSACHP